MEEIEIEVDNIDGAAEQIITFLEGTRREDVIYFHGWFGLGASVVLKAVVKRLRSSSSGSATRKAAGLDKIVHIDCSLWQSKRALQKAIAEELNLSQQVKAFFDQHDEEDDFYGVEQGARGVIPKVKLMILNELSNCNFLVVFHNGSGSYIDLWECGVPVIGAVSKRVLWTSLGRFQICGSKDVKKAAGLSVVAIIARVGRRESVDAEHSISRLVDAEAQEVAGYTGIPEPDMSPKIVLDCFLYKALMDDEYSIDWAFHAPNYWACDGIIQATTNGGRSAWEVGDALHRSMNLDWDLNLVRKLKWYLRGDQRSHTNRWVSATRQRVAPVQVMTSFFRTASAGPTVKNGNNATMILEASMFGNSDRASSLHVMHLSHCTFSFSSPPFLSCIHLRFLLLDQCKDQDATNHSGEEECYRKNNHTSLPCFWKLWVLELSYTDWYWLLSKEMMDLMVDLRELNVKGASNWGMNHIHRCSGGSNSRSLLKLRVIEEPMDTAGAASGDKRNNEASPPAVKSMDLSSWRILKTVILDGCTELEQVGTNALPPTLESFRFVVSEDNAHAKMSNMSFRGSTQLRNLLLRGLLGSLKELDLSTTAVQTLDLRAMKAPHLRRLFMLGCEELRAILWPQKDGAKIELEVLQIDTTHAARDKEEDHANHDTVVGASSATAHRVSGGRVATNLGSSCIIFLRDARLFRSLQDNRLVKRRLNVEVSTAGATIAPVRPRNTSKLRQMQQPAGKLYTNDAFVATFKDKLQSDRADGAIIDAPAVIMWMWNCPPIPYSRYDWVHCYIRIQDEAQTGPMKSASSSKQQIGAGAAAPTTTTLPAFVATKARTLHVHDSLSITCIPGPSVAAVEDLTFERLRWCRLERCPNLQGTIFTAPPFRQKGNEVFASETNIFDYLETFWASQLLKACYIWDWMQTRGFQPGARSFEDLVFLHLDYCPRLVHVLPLYTSNTHGCRSLETLEIVCCGELREVFPLVNSGSQQREPRGFPNLKRIHLYELPMLKRICGRRLSAPKLETVRIRGCWALRSLPSIRRSTPEYSAACSGSSDDSSELDEDEDAHTLPKVDCEKDWWDGLEWDGLEARHDPSLYKATHSAYYKKILRRTNVLR